MTFYTNRTHVLLRITLHVKSICATHTVCGFIIETCALITYWKLSRNSIAAAHAVLGALILNDPVIANSKLLAVAKSLDRNIDWVTQI